MMEAVDAPESWYITRDPEPKWVNMIVGSAQTDPKWIALSPSGDRITVRRDLGTDSYVVDYECAAEIEIERDTVTLDTKERAIEITQSLVDAVTYEGSDGVESVLADLDAPTTDAFS